MYEDPNNESEDPTEHAIDPAARAKDKSDEFRMHAELAAVFEGPRKFEAQLLAGLDANLARDVQRTMGRLEKAKTPDSPVLSEPSMVDAAALVDMPAAKALSTNDYHILRRPGEVMI